jgi:opacity protein-like surface antigen
MRSKLAALALAALAASAAAAAQAKSPPRQACFNARNVDNFAPQGDRVVNVRVGVRDVYRFELMTPCPDIRWNESLGLVARGSDWICSGLDAEVFTRTPIGPRRCSVDRIRKLTPAEVAALPKGARP